MDDDKKVEIAKAVMHQHDVDNLTGFERVTIGMIQRMIVEGITVAELSGLVE